MQTTPLSTLLNRMNRWSTINNIEESDKVRDLDDAIRSLKRETQTPWSLKKSTIKIFDDVLEYPVAVDHDELAYIDVNSQNGSTNSFVPNARFFFTSLQQFYENLDYRNDLAEIWDGGTKYLGIRYKDFSAGSSTVDTADDGDFYTASDDASNIAVDQTVFKTGSSSISFVVNQSSNIATVTCSPNSFGDLNYLKKYFFIYVYLGGSSVPSSINLKFGNNATSYLEKTVTTQFSGQALKVNDWNLLAFDLNAPDSTVGTIDQYNFGYFEVVLNNAPSGKYFIDDSYLRQWTLMDYWYYSTFNVVGNGSSTPSKDGFTDDSATPPYSTDDSLVGDKEWADVVMYDAILLGLTDKENEKILPVIQDRRQKSWDKLLENYPSSKPLIINSKHLFSTDYTIENNSNINN